MEDNRCLNCGENIEKDYILFVNGPEYTFDSFECAINFMAPRCSNCSSVIMGQGVHKKGEVYCTEDCANEEKFKMVIP